MVKAEDWYMGFMTKEEYIGTITVNGIKVDIGLDDYGQSYFFEYQDDGKIKTVGCGTYELDFIECICCFFDKKGYYISEYGEEAWNNKIISLKESVAIRKENGASPDIIQNLMNRIYHMETDEYNMYDFKEMYKSIGIER